jgi:hypothetical protein
MTQPSGIVEKQTKTSSLAHTPARNNLGGRGKREQFGSLKDQNGEWAAVIYDIDLRKKEQKICTLCVSRRRHKNCRTVADSKRKAQATSGHYQFFSFIFVIF